MLIQIEPTSDITIYTQISKQLIELMVRGQFIGEKHCLLLGQCGGSGVLPLIAFICISVK